MRKKKKSQVGLDIGSYSLKIAEVLAGQKRPVLNNVGIYELPKGHLPDDLPKALKSLFEKTQIQTRELNISVSGPNVIVRLMELPSMQESELAQAIPYEAEKCIPFDVKDTILDYFILENNQAEKKLKVLLAVAKRDFVDSRLRLVKDAFLTPNIVDIDSFAVYNIFSKAMPDEEAAGKSAALMNIGAGTTNVAIAWKGLLWMVRDINIGGANFTEALQQKLGIKAEEASGLKHNPGPMKDEVLAAVKGSFQKLSDEAKLSFGYYEDLYSRPIEEVYVSGGSAKLEGLIPFLRESMDLEVKLWNPLSPFEINPDIPQELLDGCRISFAVCCGLALRK